MAAIEHKSPGPATQTARAITIEVRKHLNSQLQMSPQIKTDCHRKPKAKPLRQKS